MLIGRRQLRSKNWWMHNCPSLATGPDRSALRVHPADAARAVLRSGERARVTSRAGTLAARAELSDEVMPGVVSPPQGFGHGDGADSLRVAGALPGANVNALTNDRVVEPILGDSVFNGVPVRASRDGMH